MHDFENKKVAVVGLGPNGAAARGFLTRAGAKVVAMPASFEAAPKLLKESRWGGEQETNSVPDVELVVHSSQASRKDPVVERFASRGIPVLSDLELAAHRLCCLSIA